jgi:F0F1-type ATP synthase assembly protein I
MKSLMMTVKKQSKHVACIIIIIRYYTVVVIAIHLLNRDGEAWTGLSWLRIGTGGGLL